MLHCYVLDSQRSVEIWLAKSLSCRKTIAHQPYYWEQEGDRDQGIYEEAELETDLVSQGKGKEAESEAESLPSKIEELSCVASLRLRMGMLSALRTIRVYDP